MPVMLRRALLFFLLSSVGFAQNTVLSLASASGVPGSTITLDLTLGSDQAALASTQWTLNYWPADVAAVSVAAGPSAASAGKSVWCAGGVGTLSCILAGPSLASLANGVVARVTVDLSPTTTGALSSIGLTNVLGASLGGSGIAMQARAAVITILQPPHASGIACTPPNLVTPAAATCTVALSAPAGVPGTKFVLSSANPNIIAPASVTVLAGTGSASFQITASQVSTTVLAPVTAALGARTLSTAVVLAPPGRAISAATVLNAANYASGPLAPGEITTIPGIGLGPATGVGMQLISGTVATTLAQSRVLFDGVPAPLLYVRDDQINAVVPYSIAGRSTTQVRIEHAGAISDALTLPIAATSPGIFTLDGSGAGQGAIRNHDEGLNSAANPAAPGSVVIIFATGAGLASPVPADGGITGTDVLPKPINPVSVWIGGAEAEVLYAGAAPEQVAGVLQVNARIPMGIVSGPAVPVVLAIGGVKSQPGVTLAVQ
jgi:uncharacterized protein (TIGR03437 family)